MKASNHLIGLLNILTFLLSIPILGGGIWLSTRANSTDCMKFLQWPVIAIGLAIMVISWAGFVGSCYRNTFLMKLYLLAMLFIIAALLGSILFACVVTDRGSGRLVLNKAYKDYYLQDYSGWLEDRVTSDSYWFKISSCVMESKVCEKMGDMPETAEMFYLRKLSPIESGCCKPPSECGYLYVNETVWNPNGGVMDSNPDCTKWSNDQQQLCYRCDSCKAGVIASLKNSWRNVSIINIVVLVILIILYVVAYAAYWNNRRMGNDESLVDAGMTKEQSSRFQF